MHEPSAAAFEQLAREVLRRLPPVISLFRQPLLAEMEETGVGFAELVRHVVIHEAGHHFGLSDEDMDALEASVED